MCAALLLRQHSALVASAVLPYRIMAAICALAALVIILVNSTLWRRMPAVRDNGDAAAVAATGGGRDRE